MKPKNILTFIFGDWLLLLLILFMFLVACLPVPTGTASPPTITPSPTLLDAPTATATAQPSAGCRVVTGIENGTVNLRVCAGVTCAVLDIVTEGERLTVLTAGAWLNVMTEDGVTGYVNAKYCKVEKAATGSRP